MKEYRLLALPSFYETHTVDTYDLVLGSALDVVSRERWEVVPIPPLEGKFLLLERERREVVPESGYW